MIELVLAIMIGGSFGFFLYAVRRDAAEKYFADSAYLQKAIWRFTPEPIDVRPWVVGYYVISAVVFVLFMALIPAPIVGLLFWLILFLAPKHVIEHKWEKRRQLIDEQLAPSVLQLSTSVAAGMTLAQADERVSETAPEPIRTEFRIMTNQWKHGSDFSKTIEGAKRRLKLQNFNLFASAMLVNQRMGGNVVDTLNRLAYSLQSIESMRREVRSATAEGRMNIKVLAVAPLIMLGIITLMDAEAVGLLFTTNVGWLILGVALAFTVTGTFWAWKIVNSDV